ncbi:sensor histidine kinase [Microvirga mediterraneensis]|uniref:histidine kinase n=1 Tax=Microvirga mediterraneensis TaxID=2754695 RepID=A0A838BV47_9HYPH|nr:sensor histidine kinase KdpD [Microvirga mediterraneensis]MBA1158366.1 sensor histidine kinase KdpD [Microvirga mediterraneensis]
MASTETPRACPDALLTLANREGRGRLKIFLGAAPGVGKTYAMLQAARTARDGGTDVVIGLVETHGRQETEELLGGFEILPRLSVPYRGRMVQEFDLDAALQRHPQLILVDEYAHTNAPGSRHPKRWQDVEELLAAGIDVWTTLNIQHLESLNDVVQRITRVRVRETVPDAAFDETDELVLVDLPPDELLKRLAEGKVYVQDTAARAVDNFFRPNNLVALRELTLRRAAERIDSDLLERMQSSGLEGPWAAGERILVCVGTDEASPVVVRHAKRLAEAIGAPWLAVTVERPSALLGSEERRRIDETLQLAERLGAEEAKTLVAGDMVQELLRFARFENVTQIVVGRSRGGFLSELVGRSLPHQLVHHAEDIAIHVVTAKDGQARKVRWWGRLPRMKVSRPWAPFLWSALAVATAIVVALAMASIVPLPNVSMIFLVAVLFAAVRFGIWPAVVSSILSFLGYNFFFIDPVYTFTVARPHELLALFIFLGAAVLTSALAGRAREQAAAAVSRARATRRLYEFTRRLSSFPDANAVAEGAVVELNGYLNRPVAILLSQGDSLELAASWPPEDRLDTASASAARWAYDKDETAGAGTGTLPSARWLFLPLRSSDGRVGVMGVALDGAALDSEMRTLAETVAELTAAALERARLTRAIVAANTAAESERVRNTLLASISHDFRTPLASILGAATGLIDYGPKLSEPARQDLLDQVKHEAEHLDRMVRNLLSMTRVEAGALELRRDWVDIREAFDRVVAVARRRGATQAFRLDVDPDLPFVEADASLLDQALANIIGNAVRYAGPDAKVELAARRDGRDVVLSVTDDGPGIPPALLPKVFEKFARGREHDGDGGEGTGLGLAIAKGIVDAHGGAIVAESPVADAHGTRIAIRLPLEEKKA